jgi:hypothetical protein
MRFNKKGPARAGFFFFGPRLPQLFLNVIVSKKTKFAIMSPLQSKPLF